MTGRDERSRVRDDSLRQGLEKDRDQDLNKVEQTKLKNVVQFIKM